ncbi:uncharacterized protein BDZ99DRAFT_471166 [Mytilinidion resinicola]|uniref:Uncharacterized protein n=1 Tax=Mytilinidion resinicola TaxID=574789 RepID=A0A6A6Z4U5_9PEZI|nr:uncharacterized protein BDZ99DRAFT_471166 [Mytilinidion resinicola]KAF2815848.1 hypothetical protein BDZ99DRAFT_471166 [Mytilinidion resinicola]
MDRTLARSAENTVDMYDLNESGTWQGIHQATESPSDQSPSSSKRPQWRTLTDLSRYATLKRTASGDINCSPWKPLALRAPVLACAVLVSWGLIIVLQLLLVKSQRDGGIIFAPKTNDLSLSHSFLYLYFPTIVAVIFSIFWSWIDLETKRLEPYYQLSKPDGALGKNSLMLQYPSDFIPFVPITAIKNCHWPVFWASTVMVIVTWGLVPIQAGVFATNTITKSLNDSMLVSTSLLSLDQQTENVTGHYMQSVFGITWLNETLPPYMARNYTLAPFKTQSQPIQGFSETWTSMTTLYSVDVSCEQAKRQNETGIEYFTSSNGCRFPTVGGISGNNTIGGKKGMENKEFSVMYVGFWDDDGFADYFLSDFCPIETNHTFYAAFTRNKKLATDPPENMTSIFCQPSYYSQLVNATVAVPSMHPVNAVPIGPKIPVSTTAYNTTLLEWRMNNGVQKAQTRGENPAWQWPSQLERLLSKNVSQTIDNGLLGLPYMAAFAIGASNNTLEELLDPKTLGGAFEASYQLIITRSMVDVLNTTSFATAVSTIGTRKYRTQAVILVPAFTFVVEALLGVVSVFAIALLYLSFTRPRQLRSDPGTIAAVMSLVADNASLLSTFGQLDCSTLEDMSNSIGKRQFHLEYDGQRSVIQHGESSAPESLAELQVGNSEAESSASTRGISQPIRPVEFSLVTVAPFVLFQIALVVLLALLYQRSKPYGLALPSNNRIARQILENYIPTAIATLIEPIWIVVNRLLCMLQPLEDLRTRKAVARKSIALDYSSLPPQLVIWKALRSTHFTLAAVCGMALLANVLAVAFSGLFNENSVQVLYPTTLNPSLSSKFVSINGSDGPGASSDSSADDGEYSGAYQGGLGMDQFYISESNLTTGTPLPPWTDQRFLYVPFSANSTKPSTQGFRATTRAFGAEVDCTELVPGTENSFTASVWTDPRPLSRVSSANFSMTVVDNTGKSVTCVDPGRDPQKGAETGNTGDTPPMTCQKGRSAMEFVLRLHALPNATQQDQDYCAESVFLGWARDSGQDICSDNSTKKFDRSNSLFMACRPRVLSGIANVRVDSVGHIEEADLSNTTFNISRGEIQQQFFTNDLKNLLQQANWYLFQSTTLTSGLVWHSDSFPTDFFNYEISHIINSSRLLDPNLSPPSFSDVAAPFGKVYSRLFAIWLGANKENLLLPARDDLGSPSIPGFRIELETRIFVSKPMFIISEAILGTYIIVSILVYLRRPGKYLARMPTSIASIVALFAASLAVRDFRGTAHMSKRKRERYLYQLDQRYGYGTFVGTDGRVHIGIEKQPFVRTSNVPGLIQRRTGRPQASKKSNSKEALLEDSHRKPSWIRRFW